MHGICRGRDYLKTDFTIEQIGIEELKVPFRGFRGKRFSNAFPISVVHSIFLLSLRDRKTQL